MHVSLGMRLETPVVVFDERRWSWSDVLRVKVACYLELRIITYLCRDEIISRKSL